MKCCLIKNEGSTLAKTTFRISSRLAIRDNNSRIFQQTGLGSFTCLSPFSRRLHQEVIQDSLSGQTRGLACLVLAVAAVAGGGVVIILQEVEALED